MLLLQWIYSLINEFNFKKRTEKNSIDHCVNKMPIKNGFHLSINDVFLNGFFFVLVFKIDIPISLNLTIFLYLFVLVLHNKRSIRTLFQCFTIWNLYFDHLLRHFYQFLFVIWKLFFCSEIDTILNLKNTQLENFLKKKCLFFITWYCCCIKNYLKN